MYTYVLPVAGAYDGYVLQFDVRHFDIGSSPLLLAPAPNGVNTCI